MPSGLRNTPSRFEYTNVRYAAAGTSQLKSKGIKMETEIRSFNEVTIDDCSDCGHLLTPTHAQFCNKKRKRGSKYDMFPKVSFPRHSNLSTCEMKRLTKLKSDLKFRQYLRGDL